MHTHTCTHTQDIYMLAHVHAYLVILSMRALRSDKVWLCLSSLKYTLQVSRLQTATKDTVCKASEGNQAHIWGMKAAVTILKYIITRWADSCSILKQSKQELSTNKEKKTWINHIIKCSFEVTYRQSVEPEPLQLCPVGYWSAVVSFEEDLEDKNKKTKTF